MVNRLVCSFPHEKLPRSPISCTLLSNVHTINFGIDVTIDDALFNDIAMETQTLHSLVWLKRERLHSPFYLDTCMLHF
jgi:hypothetical protein